MKELGRNDVEGTVIAAVEYPTWYLLQDVAGLTAAEMARTGLTYCETSLPRYWLLEAMAHAVGEVGPWNEKEYPGVYVGETATRYVLRIAEAMAEACRDWLDNLPQEEG